MLGARRPFLEMRVKLLALTVLIIGNLLAHQAYAEDVSTQPLTRAGCESVGMAWDEGANVCAADSKDVSRQPLTRLDCGSAGMTWNDKANVCGEEAAKGVEAASNGTSPTASDVLVNIGKATQGMPSLSTEFNAMTGRFRRARQATRRHRAPIPQGR